MNMISKGLMVVVAMTVLAGCQQPAANNSALVNGRPVAPSGQAVPGGPVGSGPVGQPQS
ncbi:hypothetical protein [Rosenbergiella australiborealis]|uniref:Lipoprotein n=1 Tax=Rosenbergiella australiborealis TaxID=1544696 RepID=A0ABS5T7U7_9GAMM|nr:hypothetical protein [Rosenbergiella australiborealis]MBT0728202.1 hypothetical protein [Rosenbergiella australiborealis]